MDESLPPHPEKRLVGRIGWMRAAVLGANDGIISTASLIVGVTAAVTNQNAVLIAGIAGPVAGAMSMAASEYVSVSSQSDTERADLTLERKELTANPASELKELAQIKKLAQIYVKRGVSRALAWQVAKQLMAKDAFDPDTSSDFFDFGAAEKPGRVNLLSADQSCQ